ncbi:MAG: menaquinone biosynthesis decarboxylase, partial [Bacteroidales bacterium]|nr:menaquinone biosynthesis decarboxylase [Bacteroidales bacterium]
MSFNNLKQFIDLLESENELARIKTFVNPEFEIAEIADRVVKSNGKALLFENTGTDFPVLINAFGSEKRMAMALGVEKLDDIGIEMNRILKNIAGSKNTFLNKIKSLPGLINIASWLPKVISGKGECQQIINTDPDLTKLPILKCWKHDGGRFITLPIVHTKDPITGTRNTGMYRMQIFEKDLTAMHWHLHKGSARHFSEYKKLKRRMPIAVALGGSPVYSYVATSPLPDNFDEYIFAGFLQKKKVELVKCITQDIEVPADVDFVIEGYVDPAEDFILEGPFGDHTGFYSLADYYPKFHITCITHRKGAIYPATIVGIPPQEDAWLGKATERIFLNPIRMTIASEIVDMTMPTEGVFHNLAIVKIKKTYEGQSQKVMNSLWGAGQMMFNKIMIVLNENCNLTDYTE